MSINLIPKDDNFAYTYRHTHINNYYILYNIADYVGHSLLRDGEFFVQYARQYVNDKPCKSKYGFKPLIFTAAVKQYIQINNDVIIIDEKGYKLLQINNPFDNFIKQHMTLIEQQHPQNSYFENFKILDEQWKNLTNKQKKKYMIATDSVKRKYTSRRDLYQANDGEYLHIICSKIIKSKKITVENKPLVEIKLGNNYNVNFLKRRFEIFHYKG